jgi:hypothetical protein
MSILIKLSAIILSGLLPPAVSVGTRLAVGLLVLPEGADVVLVIGDISENGSQFWLDLRAVAFCLFGGPGGVGSVELGSLLTHFIGGLHAMQVDNELEGLVVQTDQFGLVDVYPGAEGGIAVDRIQFLVELRDVLQQVNCVIQPVDGGAEGVELSELPLQFFEARLDAVALLVDVAGQLRVEVVEVGAEALSQPLRHRTEGLSDELADDGQVHGHSVPVLEQIHQNPYLGSGEGAVERLLHGAIERKD